MLLAWQAAWPQPLTAAGSRLHSLQQISENRADSSSTSLLKGVNCTVRLSLPWPCTPAEVPPAEPAAGFAPHLALRPAKADSSCQISNIFTVELESLLLTLFSYSHTNPNFFLLFCHFKPEAAPCWQRKESRMALPH